MTDARADVLVELAQLGLQRHEARWLVEEFFVGGDEAALDDVRRGARRRLAGEPLQYIIGHWPFRSLDLDVDPRVLIPRPETEVLVDIALQQLATGPAAAPLIVDLGCGSGAIGLSLLDELRRRGVRATLVALDKSRDALDVARANARKHQIHAVSFVESSWFSDLDSSLRGRVDLVVANPPYVSADEYATLSPELFHEPETALVSASREGVGGFDDAAVIIDECGQWLASGGSLVLEHGTGQRHAVTERARHAGFTLVEDYDDLAGHPRVMVAQRS